MTSVISIRFYYGTDAISFQLNINICRFTQLTYNRVYSHKSYSYQRT